MNPSSATFLLVVGVCFPLLAIRSAKRLRGVGARAPSHAQYVAAALVNQACLLVLALIAANQANIDLFPSATFNSRGVLAGAGLLVVSLGTLPWRWRLKTAEEQQRYDWIAPHTSRQMLLRCVTASAAATVEEIAYRGVMFTLLYRAFGSWWPAAIGCCVPFAVTHMIQGWKAVVLILVIALGLQSIVSLTGNLYTAMIVHFMYDVVAIAMLGKLSSRSSPERQPLPTSP